MSECSLYRLAQIGNNSPPLPKLVPPSLLSSRIQSIHSRNDRSRRSREPKRQMRWLGLTQTRGSIGNSVCVFVFSRPRISICAFAPHPAGNRPPLRTNHKNKSKPTSSSSLANASPAQIEPIQIDPGQPNDATPLPDNQDHLASAGKHRARPGLPPALLLVLTPIRKRLASREFWLGAIVVAWAIAALTIG